MSKNRGIFMGICLAFFALLIYLVCSTGVTKFDLTIIEWFYSIRTDQLTEIFKGITFFANTKTIVWLCIIFLLIPRVNKKIGIPIAAAAAVGSAVNRLIKHAVMRPRPDVSMHLIEQGGWSFPSGHSISSIMMYGLLAWLIRRYVKDKRIANAATVILTLMWIGVGISRVYLGVHYPTDVLGGWTLGAIFVLITITIVEKVEDRKNNRLE